MINKGVMGLSDIADDVLDVALPYIRDHKVQVAIVASVVGLLIIRRLTRKNKNANLPPGPWPLPIVGNLLHFAKDPQPYRVLVNLQKIYGDVLTFYIGSSPTVVLNSLESIREAYVKKQNDFAGRPSFYSMDMLTSGRKDIAFGDFGPVWQYQRKIAHNSIRKFATGHQLDNLIHASIQKISPLLVDQKEAFDPLEILTLYVYNIICAMCYGKQYELDDPHFIELQTLLNDKYEAFGNGMIADFIPAFRHVYKIYPTRAYKFILKMDTFFLSYLRETLQEHRDNYDPDDVRDLTSLLIQAQKENDDDGTGVNLTEEHIVQVMSDMFGAGTDTTRFTLHWFLQFVAAYPEVQKKIQDEIDAAVGPGRLVQLSDRQNLNYTEATLHEVLRLKPVAPLALPHTTTCDTTIGPYEIAEGTMVISNLWAIHRDPRLWDNPDEFKPERFINEDGIATSVIDGFMPFSAGRRVCVGESLAKAELHLSAALLLQKFTFSPPLGEKLLLENDPAGGLFIISKPFKIVVSQRN